MIASIYVVLLLTAIVGTAFVIRVGAEGDVGGVELSMRTGIVASAAVLVLWGLVAINSFEIVTYSNGTEFANSYPQLAWIAVAGGAIALYSMLQATLEEIQETGGL